MNLWTRVEQTLETIVEGVFRRGMRGGLQPVEVARQLQRAMEERRHVSVSHTYVPNEFTVELHPDDLFQFQPIIRTLTREFTAHLAEAAAKEQLSFVGTPSVAFAPSDDVPPGTIRVVAQFAEGLAELGADLRRDGDHPGTAVPPTASTEPRDEQSETRLDTVRGFTQQFAGSPDAGAAGQKSDTQSDRPDRRGARTAATEGATLVLVEPDGGEEAEFVLAPDQPVVIGRGSASDITLPDSSVSRSHARIERHRGRRRIVDLGSTNGTFVNGEPVTSRSLQDGDMIRIGEYTLRYEGGK